MTHQTTKNFKIVPLSLILLCITTLSIPTISHAAESLYDTDNQDTILLANHTSGSTRTQSSGSRLSTSIRNKINNLDDDPVKKLRIPILLGVAPHNIYDSWHDARSGGRVHEGTDILAPKGMYIISPTDAVVTETGYGQNGGNYVYTANPGGERYYYAHLDSIEETIKKGVVLEPGDVIGRVGNTGNASGGPAHLHLGIYTRNGPINPYPRLTREFSLEEKIEIIKKILSNLQKELAEKEE